MIDLAMASGFRAVVLPLLIAGALAGCRPHPVTVPPRAQEVHVAVSGDSIRLVPATVRAGDVYLVLDKPGADVILVQRMAAPEQTPGPLSEDELDRIAHGDTFHTLVSSGFPNGEPYGNVSRLVLAPGKYAFLADNPESLAARSGGVIPPASMAVLEVLP